jgi:hypothetical protein
MFHRVILSVLWRVSPGEVCFWGVCHSCRGCFVTTSYHGRRDLSRGFLKIFFGGASSPKGEKFLKSPKSGDIARDYPIFTHTRVK